tara:strand:- start:697 stop:870 length:174 start_codon:yes stop_codon:yes gene_type:complete
VRWKRYAYHIESGQYSIAKFQTTVVLYGAYRGKECLGVFDNADDAKKRCKEDPRLGV